MYNQAIRKCTSPPLNLIQACDVQSSDLKVYISIPPSAEAENLLSRRGSNPGPAGPEADMLPSEPERQAKIWDIFTIDLKRLEAWQEQEIT